MENVITTGQRLFANKKDALLPCITLGCSAYLVALMTCMHLSFGVLITSSQYVGSPLTCQGLADEKIQQHCASELHYLPIGSHVTEDDRRYAFFKMTHWIFTLIGKQILFTKINSLTIITSNISCFIL